MDVVKEEVKYPERLSTTELQCDLLPLRDMIRNLYNIISPVFDAGYDHQQKGGGVSLKQASTTNLSLWHHQAYDYTTNNVLHTENDCRYILITFPKKRV